MKLHGSINWGRCKNCKKIVPALLNDQVKALFLSPGTLSSNIKFDIGTRINEVLCSCGTNLVGPPILVPPSWNKTQFHKQLSNVWKCAAQVLSEADSIYIVGYSLPITDEFFRYLFALGTEGQTYIRRIIVVNPMDEVKDRFTAIIGKGIEKRFEFENKKFGQYSGELINYLENNI